MIRDGVKRILAINGRNFGKTELAIHILSRTGLTRESLNKDIGHDELIDSYYVAPSIVHARRIIWDNARLKQIIPEKYILDINKNDRMVYLTTDGKDPCAYIKIEGAENIWGLVGVKHKGIMAIDELYMVQKEFLEAHEEDLAAYDPPLLQFSTWPKLYPHWIDRMAKEYQQNKEWRYMNRPGTDNPFIERRNPGYFEKQKNRYQMRGDLAGYQREILSMRVIGGVDSIFPQFQCRGYIAACNAAMQDDETLVLARPDLYNDAFAAEEPGDHVIRHDRLMAKIAKDFNKLTPCIITDPGHATRFAALFMMCNPYTKELFYLDEIYEGNRHLINTPSMLARIYQKAKDLWPGFDLQDIRKCCDEAALWFRMESVALSQDPKGPTLGNVFAWVTTEKAAYKHEYGYSMMKAAMNTHRFFVSDHCPWFIWEILNHQTRLDQKGRVKMPDRDDHLIDCSRYGLALLNYTLTEEEIERKMVATDEFMAVSLDREMKDAKSEREESWGGENVKW